MELLYFISGILSVGIIYGVILLRKVKFEHTELLNTFNKSSYISSTRRAELKEEVNDIKTMIIDIQSTMEKDQYESLSEINGKLRDGILLAEANNRKISETTKVFNKNITDAFNEIQQVKRGLKALGQDPNMLSRY